ncbi:MAG: hypothetical protein CMQ20_10290 [Gammaproteobacteria bacterium]|jgi:hypothetical protein|nr:hypothetical protein [Gammaproteobacteria bacterium]|tara:strand:+ start:366 stop:1040 length:675 start_codon:yes stop_codon:yes gene_type:complete
MGSVPHKKITLGVLFAVLTLGGCQLETIKPEAPPEPAAPVEIDPRILPLLAQAEQAFTDNRLTTPLEDNAYLRYLQVLAIDPDNDKANQGIAAIVEKYLAWSIENVYQARYKRARDFLNKARSVDETHPNIPAIENMVKSYASGRSKTYELPRKSAQMRDSKALSKLQQIAVEISKNQATATIAIEAPSDAIGRWIYQQLNEATVERVRARFEITSRVRVHLFY